MEYGVIGVVKRDLKAEAHVHNQVHFHQYDALVCRCARKSVVLVSADGIK